MEKCPCSIFIDFSQIVGNIIRNDFLLGQKSVGHLVLTVKVKKEHCILCKEHKSDREKPFAKGQLLFSLFAKRVRTFQSNRIEGLPLCSVPFHLDLGFTCLFMMR